MKRFAFIGLIMSFWFQGFSQGFTDNALLFSRTIPGGSARIQAIGGTQISLGGDYSAAFSNPAGLGMYNRSEFTITPALTSGDITATYAGRKVNESKLNFNIPGISFVINKPSGKEDGFLGGSFGLSLTRTNDLHYNYSYTGVNDRSSILDYFINDANLYVEDNPNYNPDNMLRGEADFYNLTALAYNNYLIEAFYNEDYSELIGYGSKLSPLIAEEEVRTLTQREVIDRQGAQNQWSVSYGANFNDNFFIGAGVGITTLRYELKQVYTESNFSFSEDASYNPLDYFRLEENLEIRGSGVNLTLGFIYRPVDHVQVGASYVTPTYYQITDTYTASMESQWNNFDYYFQDGTFVVLNDVYEAFDAPLISEYSITTPSKFNFGATYISKMGFISADVELVNYSKAKYRSNDDVSFDYENDEIKSAYTSVVNYRIGGEYRYDIFRVRAGFNYRPDPSRVDEGVDKSITTVSGGVGVRWKKAFIDLAVVHSSTEANRIPYTAPDKPTPVASLEAKKTNYICTVGFTF